MTEAVTKVELAWYCLSQFGPQDVEMRKASKLVGRSYTGSAVQVARQARATSQNLAQVAGVANPVATGGQMLQECKSI